MPTYLKMFGRSESAAEKLMHQYHVAASSSSCEWCMVFDQIMQ